MLQKLKLCGVCLVCLGMNRHHYGLFVHNCRLVLLLRRQPSSVYDDPFLNDVLRPAEWRWNLPEVCDRNWHHYVVSVDNAQQVCYYVLTALVDGRCGVQCLARWSIQGKGKSGYINVSLKADYMSQT